MIVSVDPNGFDSYTRINILCLEHCTSIMISVIFIQNHVGGQLHGDSYYDSLGRCISSWQ